MTAREEGPGNRCDSQSVAGNATAVGNTEEAIASLQFYSNVSQAIDIWVAREYVPLFQPGFNLIILLAAIVGISLLVRRLSE